MLGGQAKRHIVSLAAEQVRPPDPKDQTIETHHPEVETSLALGIHAWPPKGQNTNLDLEPQLREEKTKGD